MNAWEALGGLALGLVVIGLFNAVGPVLWDKGEDLIDWIKARKSTRKSPKNDCVTCKKKHQKVCNEDCPKVVRLRKAG